jgi:hypothetical protein
MAVDESSTIDIIGTAADGRVSLIISDHLDWDDSLHHQQILQDKLNAYLRFFESGEMYTRIPGSRGQWPQIEIVFKFEPDENGRTFLSKAAKAIEGAGLTLKHGIHSDQELAN